MSEASSVALRPLTRVLVTLLTLAVVIVPTVMRSRQHVELRDTTRLSIRLNWQSDAPPQKDLLDSAVRGPLAVAAATVIAPEPPRIPPRERLTREPVRQSPFDNAPDLFRGPPSLFI